jgi:hypothetical protein
MVLLFGRIPQLALVLPRCFWEDRYAPGNDQGFSFGIYAGTQLMLPVLRISQ